MRLRPVESRAEAERLVRDKQAGTALVIPERHAGGARRRTSRVARALHRRRQVPRAPERPRPPARAARRAGGRARRDGARRMPAASAIGWRASSIACATRSTPRAAGSTAAWRGGRARARRGGARGAGVAHAPARDGGRTRTRSAPTHELDRQLADVRAYLDTVAARRRDFEAWLAELRRLAGSHAEDIPPPPAFPEPPAVADAAPRDRSRRSRSPSRPRSAFPPPPPLPKPPALALPDDRACPRRRPLPGALDFEERDVERRVVAHQHLRPERAGLQRHLPAARHAARRVARAARRARLGHARPPARDARRP